MRRDKSPEPPLLAILADRWRRAGDPRAEALEAGQAVLLGLNELPPDYHSAHEVTDRCYGYADDYELRPYGELRPSLELHRRRLHEPGPVWRDGAWHEIPAVWRDGHWWTAPRTDQPASAWDARRRVERDR